MDDREHHLESLMARYQTPVLRMCFAYLRDRQLAEDAAQETFVKAYRALAAFRGDSDEKTWLMRIAINTCKDMRRGAMRAFRPTTVLFGSPLVVCMTKRRVSWRSPRLTRIF